MLAALAMMWQLAAEAGVRPLLNAIPMPRGRLASVALITVIAACGDAASRSSQGSDAVAGAPSQSVVGRWALVSLVRNGDDLTSRIAAAGAVRYYTFNANGTFRITLSDSVTETGTWSQDTTVLPRVFDHIPDVQGKPGPYVPGIFAIAGDTLTISLVGPNPDRRHPTQFRSVLADSSWLLVYRRASP